jgi:hypothetical protein
LNSEADFGNGRSTSAELCAGSRAAGHVARPQWRVDRQDRANVTAASAAFQVIVDPAINAIWFSALVLLFGKLASMARGGHFRHWLKVARGAMFVGFGL